MYSFEKKWLASKFPKPNNRSLQRLNLRFPNAPPELQEFFLRVRGGRFFNQSVQVRGGCLVEHGFAIDCSWSLFDLFGAHEWLLVERRRGRAVSDLFSYGEDKDLVPVFASAGQTNIYYDCATRAILCEDGETGLVRPLADTLPEFLKSIEHTPIQDFQQGCQIDDLITLGEDERVLAHTDEELRTYVCEIPCFQHRQMRILHRAAESDRIDLFKSLLKRGFDPFETDGVENNCIHIAVKASSIETLKLLTKQFRSNLNVKNGEGKTAFQIAIEMDRSRCAIWLAHLGADTRCSIHGREFKDYIEENKHNHQEIHGYLNHGLFRDDLVDA